VSDLPIDLEARIREMLLVDAVPDRGDAATPAGFIRVATHEAILGSTVSRFIVELDALKREVAELKAHDRKERATFFRRQVQNILTGIKETSIAFIQCGREVGLAVAQDRWVVRVLAGSVGFSIASSGLVIGLIVGISSVATQVSWGDMQISFEGAGRSAESAAADENRGMPMPHGPAPGVTP
jgi:hypothetical protein